MFSNFLRRFVKFSFRKRMFSTPKFSPKIQKFHFSQQTRSFPKFSPFPQIISFFPFPNLQFRQIRPLMAFSSLPIGFLPVSYAQQPTIKDFEIEPSTKTSFPAILDTHQGTLSIASTGARIMWFLFTTYAVAIYLDNSLIRSLALSVTNDQEMDPKALQEIRSKALLSQTNKAIRIVPVRETDSIHLSRSFSQKLRDRLLENSGSLGELKSAKRLQEVNTIISLFEECWPRQSFPIGTTIDFLILDDSKTLMISLNGHIVGSPIHSDEICHELLSLYLSDQSSVPALRDSFGKQLVDFFQKWQ